MSDLNVNGPSKSKEPLLDSSIEKKLESKKLDAVASQFIGNVSGSKTQAHIKKMRPTDSSHKLGEFSLEFVQKIVQKFVKKSESDKKLQLILEEFKSVDRWISDFEKMTPFNLENEDSIMLHQQHIVDIRERLQQIRDRADAFKNPKIKNEILVVADTLMARLNELLDQKFDAVEFFRVPETKQLLDDELASYFPSVQSDLDALLEELEQFPEGEKADEIPKNARVKE